MLKTAVIGKHSLNGPNPLSVVITAKARAYFWRPSKFQTYVAFSCL